MFVDWKHRSENALYVVTAHGVYVQGINMLLSADLYSNIVVPIALCGSAI